MAKKNGSTKKATSLYLDSELVQRLDNWVKWQLEAREYETDRSHVVNVLLRRFLDRNDSHLTKSKDNQISLDVE